MIKIKKFAAIKYVQIDAFMAPNICCAEESEKMGQKKMVRITCPRLVMVRRFSVTYTNAVEIINPYSPEVK